MVGVNYFLHQIGTVAVLATLFVASCVNGDKGCTLDFQHEKLESDFDLGCGDSKSSWTVNDVLGDSGSLKKKALVLDSDKEGCLKFKHPVHFNSTSKLVFRFFRDNADNGKLTVTLVPKEGSCVGDECTWFVDRDPQYKTEKWVDIEHKFPLKSAKEYYVHLHVDKSKGKLMVDHLNIPGSPCRIAAKETKEMENQESERKLILPDQLIGAESNESEKSFAPCLVEISKNLMLTSASVLTLNNLLN